MNVILIGQGGRENAIAWKLNQSQKVSAIFCVPGNAGTALLSKCQNKECLATIQDYVDFAKQKNCTLAVIGPEDPLAAGAADAFWQGGIPCVGPKKTSSMLEASKDFAKSFMQKYNVSCAKSKTFLDLKQALDYVKNTPAPLVIKADGLAAGKGVVVAKTTQEAVQATTDLMQGSLAGDAGKKVVIEEYLAGTEVSILCAASVTADLAKQNKAVILPFLTARDHKRLLDGAKGPNTGGMGAISPCSDITKEQLQDFQKNILEPTLDGMIKENMDYRGFIFFGLMLTDKGVKALEYNVRLGDPETQAVLPLLKSDFFDLCKSITNGSLCDFKLEWQKGFCVCPMAVSFGYPASYKKGFSITINKNIFDKTGAILFVSGAKQDKRKGSTKEALVTSGGRVLCCSAIDLDFNEARKKAYTALEAIDFQGMFYRKDIGLKGAASSTL